VDNQVEEGLEEIRQRLEALQSLLKFPPWAQAVELIERQCIARSFNFNQKPVASIDEALIQNWEKGIVYGMRLAMKQPAAMAELLREQFNAKLVEERAHVTNQ
jgi:hypothetical protein